MRDCRLCDRPLAGDNPRDICFQCWREEYHKLEEQKAEAERQRDELLAACEALVEFEEKRTDVAKYYEAVTKAKAVVNKMRDEKEVAQ